MASTVELRSLLLTGSAVDRRKAWRLVERVPSLEAAFQRVLVDSGQLEHGQSLEFVTIGGYEFEQIEHPSGNRVIKVDEFEADYSESVEQKIASFGFKDVDRDITQCRPYAHHGCVRMKCSLISIAAPSDAGVDDAAVDDFTLQMGLARADIVQLIELGRRYPGMIHEFTIVARSQRAVISLMNVGLHADDPCQGNYAPILVGSKRSDRKYIKLHRTDLGWSNEVYFLAVELPPP